MKRLLVWFVVLGLVACSTAEAQQNPGFEAIDMAMPTNAANWNEFSSATPVTAVRSTTMPRTGAAHMDLTVGGANGFAGVFQNLGQDDQSRCPDHLNRMEQVPDTAVWCYPRAQARMAGLAEPATNTG